MPVPQSLGTAERPLRVAIIGAGPSGYYAADALLKAEALHVRCDMLDRLPTPFGLVRGGVAPDHQSIKKVTQTYEKVAAHPHCRFFGNVRLGADVSVDDLRSCYDALIYAVGNESDRHMGIPGEDLPGSHSATEFVGWYNGHPDYTDLDFDLSVESAAVVGVGNVAMDVARVLARRVEELEVTDIAAHAIAPLRASKLKRIYVLGRRGPAQAAFSPKEIKELGHIEGADLIVAQEDAALDEVSATWLAAHPDRDAEKNLAYLQEKAAEAPTGATRQIVLKFLSSPEALLPDDDGKVARLRVRRNTLVASEGAAPRPKATERVEDLEVGIVFKAVGYRGVPIEGVPFHDRWGLIPNVDGRVVADQNSTTPLPGEYVVGWAKRGPSGLIGTNKPDAIATVQALLADYSAHPPRRATSESGSLEALLRSRGHRWVDFEGWRALDAAELERGHAAGKLREKFVRLPDMLKHLSDS